MSLEDVEGATKIRLRYLRAMENEEWDALPGGTYSRAFLRTYASYLGLDGERIADDYRDAMEMGGAERSTGVEPAQLGAPPRTNRRLPGRALGLLVAVVLIGAVVAVLVIDGGGDGGASKQGSGPAAGKEGGREGGAPGGASAPAEVALELVASGEVWVCLLGADGEPLINGVIMEAGEEGGPFRSKEFAMAFGNGQVSLLVDGEDAEIPASSSPIGFEIDSTGNLKPLAEGERPECA